MIPPSLDTLRSQLTACLNEVAGDDSYAAKRRLAGKRQSDEWSRLDRTRGKHWVLDCATATTRQLAVDAIDIARVRPRLLACSSAEDFATHRYFSATSAFPTRDRPGRRMKLLLVDDGHPGSPVMAIGTLSSTISVLRARDEWIGWPRGRRDPWVWERLAYIMDLSTCIGVPPYGSLTSAKLLAHLVVSDIVLDLYRARYAGRRTSRLGRVVDAFALVVATGAFKTKTPTYRGIDVDGRRIFRLIGKTRGYSSAHVPDALYCELAMRLAGTSAAAAAIRRRGPHVRFHNLRVFARLLGLPEEVVLRPGQRRSVYVAEAASNARMFLRGEVDDLVFTAPSADRIIEIWRQRWLWPRTRRVMARSTQAPQVNEEDGNMAGRDQGQNPLLESQDRYLAPRSNERRPMPGYQRPSPQPASEERLEALGLRALLGALRCSWTTATSFSPELWRSAGPAIGQCAVTALIVQDAVGGEILRGAGLDGTHYWNRLPSGEEIDLTAEQFDTCSSFETVEVRPRSYILSFPDTSDRYMVLRRRLEDTMAGAPGTEA